MSLLFLFFVLSASNYFDIILVICLFSYDLFFIFYVFIYFFFLCVYYFLFFFFFFQAEDGIRDLTVTGVQTCALPIYQVEKNYLHRKSTNSSTFSACGRWPQLSSTRVFAPGIKRLSSSRMPTGRMRSCLPQMIFTGTSMRCSHFGRKGSCSRGSHARRAVAWRFLRLSSTSTGADRRACTSFSSTNRFRMSSSGAIRKISAGCTPGAATPAGLTSTSDFMRAVSRTAISIAIHPPMELPTTVTFLKSSCFRKSG